MEMVVHTENLRMARYKKGLSTTELAKRVGLSYVRMSAIETGKAKRIRPENVLKICNALEINMEDLISFV